MTHIFYLLGIIFLWKELVFLVQPITETNEIKRFKVLSAEHKDKHWDDYSKEFKSIIKHKSFDIIIVLWFLIGLFSSQWIIFLFLLVFNFIIISPLSKVLRYSMGYVILHWFNSLIGLIIGVFIIINKYHLHINVFEYIKSLF